MGGGWSQNDRALKAVENKGLREACYRRGTIILQLRGKEKQVPWKAVKLSEWPAGVGMSFVVGKEAGSDPFGLFVQRSLKLVFRTLA